MQEQVGHLKVSKAKRSNKETRTKKDDKIGDIMEWWDNFTNWLSGDDDNFSESSFSDADEDFADFYNEVTNDSDYSDDLWVDDSFDWTGSGYGEEDYSDSLEGPFAWLYEEDPEFLYSVFGDNFGMDEDQYGWNEDETSYIYPDDYSGSGFEDLIASDPEFATWYNEVTNDSEYSDDLWVDDSIDWTGSGYSGNPFLEFVGNLISGSGSGSGKKDGGGGIMGLLNSLMGGSKNMLDNDLVKMLLAKKLLDDDREGGAAAQIPIGQEAYGGGGNQPSYQISNVQPALLPGMAYANQPTTFNGMPPPTAPPTTPPGMQGGGIASLENRMEGPGDVTKAMLEPGEFVMTRKATQNLTPEYLYSLMDQAENAGRMR